MSDLEMFVTVRHPGLCALAAVATIVVGVRVLCAAIVGAW